MAHTPYAQAHGTHANRKCVWDDCERYAIIKNLCRKHYDEIRGHNRQPRYQHEEQIRDWCECVDKPLIRCTFAGVPIHVWQCSRCFKPKRDQ